MATQRKFYDVTGISLIADHLGQLKAEIKELQDVAKGLEAIVKQSGETVLEGELFKLTVVEAERRTVDWKAVATKLEPTRQLVSAHTKVTHPVSIRINAHSTK